jgi:hypothetical protein
MPVWIYELHPFWAAIVLVIFVETVSLAGLLLMRRFVISRLGYRDLPNEPVSGTVQAIGVFYGITVGLIAVGVWNTNSNSTSLVSNEATAIAVLYRDVSGYPSPIRDELRAKLREYPVFLINQAWPAQQIGQGQRLDGGARILDDFQSRLYSFEPATQGQTALHTETLGAYNNLIQYRRLRLDAVDNHLSGVMWAVIWVGAAISITIAYFYKIEDPRLHAVLVALMAAFLAMLLFMIVINDRPFFGHVTIPSDPYQLILDKVIDRVK